MRLNPKKLSALRAAIADVNVSNSSGDLDGSDTKDVVMTLEALETDLERALKLVSELAESCYEDATGDLKP